MVLTPAPPLDVQMALEEAEPIPAHLPLFGVWAQTRGGEQSH